MHIKHDTVNSECAEKIGSVACASYQVVLVPSNCQQYAKELVEIIGRDESELTSRKINLCSTLYETFPLCADITHKTIPSANRGNMVKISSDIVSWNEEI